MSVIIAIAIIGIIVVLISTNAKKVDNKPSGGGTASGGGWVPVDKNEHDDNQLNPIDDDSERLH